MYTLIVWSLVAVFGPAAYSINSSVCDVPMMIGSCEKVSGPAVNCSEYLIDQLTNIIQLKKQSEHISEFKGSKYNKLKLGYLKEFEYKAAIDNLTYFVTETFAREQNVSKDTCIAIDKLVMETKTHGTRLKSYLLHLYWMDYLYPAFGNILFIFGMAGNFMIVVMYLIHEDLQTRSNMVVVNLAVGDVFLLIYRIPLTYISVRWMSEDTYSKAQWATTYLTFVSFTVSVYSMVLLSLLKYLATTCTPGSRTQEFLQNRKAIRVLLMLVWALAAIIGVYAPVDIVYDNIKLRLILRFLWFVFLCVLPLIVITVLSIATSRILRRIIPGEQTTSMIHESLARKKGADVIVVLVIIFSLTHVPYSIGLLTNHFKSNYYNYISYFLTTLNSCLNPVALFITSTHFRKHLKNDFAKLKCKISEVRDKIGQHPSGETTVQGRV